MKYFIKRWKNNSKKDRLSLLEKEILCLYINKDLVEFLNQLTKEVFTRSEKLHYLEFCKKIINQNVRKPNEDHYLAFKEQYDSFFRSIKKEQLIYDPIKWLDAEIDYANALRLTESKEFDEVSDTSAQPKKDWLTFAEMLSRFETSKMALRRRMAEGMPFVKFGNQLRFFPKAVDEWLAARN